MTIDKRRVKLHFDRHAGEYESQADVQREMAERLAAVVAEAAPQWAAGAAVGVPLDIDCL